MWYKFYALRSITIYECEAYSVYDYDARDSLFYSGHHALQSPDYQFGEGEYEICLQYECQYDQAYELIAKDDFENEIIITNGKMAAGQNECKINFRITPENLWSGNFRGDSVTYVLYCDYSGEGSLLIDSLWIYKDGELKAKTEKDDFTSEYVGIENGYIDHLPHSLWRFRV